MNQRFLELTTLAVLLLTAIVGCDDNGSNQKLQKDQVESQDALTKSLNTVKRGDFTNTKGDRISLLSDNGISYAIAFELETIGKPIECREVAVGEITSIDKLDSDKFPFAKTALSIQLDKDAIYYRVDSDGDWSVSGICEEIALLGRDDAAEFPTTASLRRKLPKVFVSGGKAKGRAKDRAKGANDDSDSNLKDEIAKKKSGSSKAMVSTKNARNFRTLLFRAFSGSQLELAFIPEGDNPDQSRDTFILKE